LFQILKQGTGNVVAKDAAVYIHYNSYFEMEEVPFDTSYLRSHKPNRIQLGSGSVYSGFEIALTTMKQGEKSQFLVQPAYAFGKMGVPPRIPPGKYWFNRK
jgi:FKBP-type peptidyl-prolyl cis-trans isomerase